MHDTLTELTELLRELPGIGPRQARRLAYWFVRRDRGWVESFARTLREARHDIKTCAFCMRLFPATTAGDRCAICANPHRDTHTLLVVEKDVDLENIERTGAYKGRYFVLGGTASMLDKEPEKYIRVAALERVLRAPESDLEEVILALSATTEGEDTAQLLRERMASVFDAHGLRVTVLGRGLSTGTELEYVDTDTLTNALRGRS